MFSAVHFYYVLYSSVINVVSFLQLRLQHKRSLLFIAKSIPELMDVKESKLLGIQKGQKLFFPHCIDFMSISLPTCIYCFYLISDRLTCFVQWIFYVIIILIPIHCCVSQKERSWRPENQVVSLSY